MQVCHDCNHPIGADDLYCSHCGSAVDAADGTVAVAHDPGPSSPRSGSALGSLETILKADASDAGRLTLAAFERLCDGEIDDALLAAESAVTLDPRLWTSHLVAGVARNQRGETEQAEAHLQDALQAEPTAIHYKTSLERMLASSPAVSRRIIPAGRFSFSPAAWAGIIGVPVLLVGLMLIAATGSRRNEFERTRPRYDAAGGRTAMAPIRPQAQPFPTPAPRQPSPPLPAPVYTPPYNPTPSPYTTPGSATRPSAPPPIDYGDNESRSTTGNTAGDATGSRPDVLPSAEGPGPFLPLPPAKPDVSGAPELRDRDRTAGTDETRAGAERTAARTNPTPWNQPVPRNQPSTVAANVISGHLSAGSARVGNEPEGSRTNLPPPADAVTSSARVRPAPAVANRAPTASASPAAPARPNGRALQVMARRLRNQGRFDEAAQAYQDAIEAYQRDIDDGRNVKAAEYGISVSKAAIDLLESRQ